MLGLGSSLETTPVTSTGHWWRQEAGLYGLSVWPRKAIPMVYCYIFIRNHISLSIGDYTFTEHMHPGIQKSEIIMKVCTIISHSLKSFYLTQQVELWANVLTRSWLNLIGLLAMPSRHNSCVHPMCHQLVILAPFCSRNVSVNFCILATTWRDIKINTNVWGIRIFLGGNPRTLRKTLCLFYMMGAQWKLLPCLSTCIYCISRINLIILAQDYFLYNVYLGRVKISPHLRNYFIAHIKFIMVTV